MLYGFVHTDCKDENPRAAVRDISPLAVPVLRRSMEPHHLPKMMFIMNIISNRPRHTLADTLTRL